MVAQIAHLEAAAAGSTRQRADAEVRCACRLWRLQRSRLQLLPWGCCGASLLGTPVPPSTLPPRPCPQPPARRPQAKQQEHARSLGRLKESLHWCASETDALKRQLAERDRQLAGLQREARGGGGRR